MADLAKAYYQLGNASRYVDKVRSRDAFENAITRYRELATLKPGDAQAQMDMSTTYMKLSSVQLDLSDLSAAIRSARAAVEIDQQLRTSDPANKEYRKRLETSQGYLFSLLD